jgi:hypothetical protein
MGVPPSNTATALGRWLRTDPCDPGCGETVAKIDVYAELALLDSAGAGRRYPGLSVHFAACRACALDLEGLLLLIA